MKYRKDQIVNFAGNIYKVTRCISHGFTGKEYDIEAVKPDKNIFFEVYTNVPEGCITF